MKRSTLSMELLCVELVFKNKYTSANEKEVDE